MTAPAPTPTTPKPQAAAVIVAAGNSTRMELDAGQRKPFLQVGGRTVLEHTVAAFHAAPQIHEIVVVAQADDLERIGELARDNPLFAKLRATVPGGAERTDSVRAGVQACSPGIRWVAIHDGARPLIRPATIAAAVECAIQKGAALVAVPVQDTIKRGSGLDQAEETLNRQVLWAAQTPQVFRRGQILDLLERGGQGNCAPTDDAALYEYWVGPIPIVRGDSTNLKLTTPTDLEIMRALLRLRSEGALPQ